MNDVDWVQLFKPDTPVLEIFVRGTIMYLSLFALLRFVLRREAGSLGITDLLVIVLVADAAQNGMAGEYRSVTDGLLLVATIAGWSHLLNWLAFRYPWMRRIVDPPRVRLVRDGRFLRQNLEREKITEEEMLSALHIQGCDDVSEVRAAWIEPDGEVSVIKFRPEGPGRRNRKRGA